MAGSDGLGRDACAALAPLIASCPRALTTPQIVARSGFAGVAVRRHLAELEREGQIGRIAGRPQRWYWIGDAAAWAAVA